MRIIMMAVRKDLKSFVIVWSKGEITQPWVLFSL